MDGKTVQRKKQNKNNKPKRLEDRRAKVQGEIILG